MEKVWLENTLPTYDLDICPKFRSFFFLNPFFNDLQAWLIPSLKPDITNLEYLNLDLNPIFFEPRSFRDPDNILGTQIIMTEYFHHIKYLKEICDGISVLTW